jgi:ABC-type sugar transport system ATPase subunit
MLELSHINKSFNKIKVLEDISFSIAAGEFFAVLGPSGSGKTTLLNVIAGLLKQDSGTVVINGVDVTDTFPNKRNIGMVFQNFLVYPHLNVYENIRYPLRYVNSCKKEDVRPMIESVANMLNITNLLTRRSYELSGGEKQRVALARAIIKSPTLFLLDEPLSNLDYQLRLKIRTELKNLHKTLNKTFIYVTHDQAEAFYLAGKVAIIDSGRIIQVGAPREILDIPNSLFTARFVHSYYNEISVAVSREGDELDIISEAGRMRVEKDSTKANLMKALGHVMVFIKCQDISSVEKGDDTLNDKVIQFQAKIKDILYVSDVHLLELDNGLRMSVLSADFNRGDMITACAKKRSILLYDEQRLLGSLG